LFWGEAEDVSHDVLSIDYKMENNGATQKEDFGRTVILKKKRMRHGKGLRELESIQLPYQMV
jgi:hypothetical protein